MGTGLVLVAVQSSESWIEDAKALASRWNMQIDQTLRIFVVDGLVYLEDALSAFHRGHKFVPEKVSRKSVRWTHPRSRRFGVLFVPWE